MPNLEIHGYPVNSEYLEKPLQFQEVTFCCGPETLREIARFLSYAADEMELHGDRFGHEHLQHWSDSWPESAPDVIAVRAHT